MFCFKHDSPGRLSGSLPLVKRQHGHERLQGYQASVIRFCKFMRTGLSQEAWCFEVSHPFRQVSTTHSLPTRQLDMDVQDAILKIELTAPLWGVQRHASKPPCLGLRLERCNDSAFCSLVAYPAEAALPRTNPLDQADCRPRQTPPVC